MTTDWYDQILGLRALRSYRDEPLPDVTIERLLEAARWTGSSKNLQKWSFVVVDGERRIRLADQRPFSILRTSTTRRPWRLSSVEKAR